MNILRRDNYRIFKYKLPIEDRVVITMPRMARVLSVQVQRGEAFIWAEVNTQPDAGTEERTFYVVGTGHPMPKFAEVYIGTFQLHDGDLVFHLYETTWVGKDWKRSPPPDVVEKDKP